jgi:prolyl oligopeptidase
MPTAQEFEDINGAAAIAWAKQQNEVTFSRFKDKKCSDVEQDVLKILEAKDKLPSITLYPDSTVYNFWRDDVNVRGLWRRTTLEEYKKDNLTIDWEILLDLDALAKAENENWKYEGIHMHTVQDIPSNRALICLSRGGGDIHVAREFDMTSKQFVQDGFSLPEAKSDIAWYDHNTLLVATDFGPDSLTESSYPRTLKLWRRGTNLADAEEIFSIPKDHMSIGSSVLETPEGTFTFVTDTITFWQDHLYILHEDRKMLVKVNKPDDAAFLDVFQGNLLFLLRSAWRKFPAGSLVALDYASINAKEHTVTLLKAPTNTLAIQSASSLLNSIIVHVTDNVSQQIYRLQKIDGEWQEFKLNYPETGSTTMTSMSAFSDQHLAWYESFLTPDILLLTEQGTADIVLKQAPQRFDSSNCVVEQKHATSKDGTQIPYYIVRPHNMKYDGHNATLLYGYGGFECSMTPYYSAVRGKTWLESGNVYVIANIRGGNEFGPAWHQAALKEKRQNAFDDFIAVAEDLIARGITSPAHLAIEGGSNGGLLVAAVTMQRPELFKAVVCEVPLTDMLRYNVLRSKPEAQPDEDESESAGASWVDEYGDPEDPLVRSALKRYSPLHNIKPRSEVLYPQILFTSSTKDDRVHPYHARIMVAKMQALGHTVYYFENHEGGHSGAANLKQEAFNHALNTSYLLQLLGAAPRLENAAKRVALSPG